MLQRDSSDECAISLVFKRTRSSDAGGEMSRRGRLTCTAVLAVSLISVSFAAITPRTSTAAVIRPGPGAIDTRNLSAGGRAWFERPAFSGRERSLAVKGRIARGSNVDANDPKRDLVGGQSETAIAASGATVVAAWNDATGFLVQPMTDRRASLTGLALSVDRGKHFRDLLGLRNDQPKLTGLQVQLNSIADSERIEQTYQAAREMLTAANETRCDLCVITSG